ncbi:unnamed protein product [Arctia plantaginis]|uniref:Uncharacterized protein n=1 Tax=Arctia plantaginis TaxID=874455 RepID=A0A8S1AHD5_ARCPL|nr:unnamed protein product [Arctia plantaginis]
MSRQKNKTIDDNNIFDYILGRPTWLHDELPPAVEIIELNSSNEEISPREPNRDGRRHAWSYVNNEEMQQIENSYKINELARERRRLQNARHHTIGTYTSLEPNVRDNGVNTENNYDLHHSKIHNNSNTRIGDKLVYNRNVNCFGMTSNDLVSSDNSSDGQYADVEVITTADVVMSGGNDWDQCSNNFYNEEIITYDTDLDQETRTIWIYSFKNKHLLRDDDFEEVPSDKSCSSSNSTDSSGEQTNDTSRRIGSPIPGTYIPRLDLTLVPRLSTVMEISERNIEPTPEKSIKSVKSTSRKLKVHSNNWCVSETTKEGGKRVGKHEKSTSIINWMSLSPRDRRRLLKHKSVSDSWVESFFNLSEEKDNKVGKVLQNDDDGEDGVKLQVDVEVHVDNEANGDTCQRKPNSAKNAVKANTDDMSSINKIKYADAANEELPRDRGDNNVKLVAPVIHLTSTLRKSEITHPIENLESPEWIHERDEKETSVFDYVSEKSESILDTDDNNIVDHLWMKNTVPFLKPSDWTKFKPIADSPVSYHLSLGSIEERKTWFKRLINFLKCCK